MSDDMTVGAIPSSGNPLSSLLASLNPSGSQTQPGAGTSDGTSPTASNGTAQSPTASNGTAPSSTDQTTQPQSPAAVVGNDVQKAIQEANSMDTVDENAEQQRQALTENVAQMRSQILSSTGASQANEVTGGANSALA